MPEEQISQEAARLIADELTCQADLIARRVSMHGLGQHTIFPCVRCEAWERDEATLRARAAELLKEAEEAAVPTHYLEWEFDRDGVNARAVCTEPEGADCQIQCVHGCESWTIERDQDGKPYHRIGHLDDDGQEVRHDMEPVDYCNVTEFLNDDPSLLPELGSGLFVIARTPIEPVWEGDHYSWKRFETEHRPKRVISMKGIPFVDCSCAADHYVQTAEWLKTHWQGTEADGVAAVDAVIERQASAS